MIAFIVPAIVGSLVSWMTSRMTIYNMHGTAIFAALATAALAGQKARIAGWSIALVLLTFTFMTQFHTLMKTISAETDSPNFERTV